MTPPPRHRQRSPLPLLVLVAGAVMLGPTSVARAQGASEPALAALLVDEREALRLERAIESVERELSPLQSDQVMLALIRKGTLRNSRVHAGLPARVRRIGPLRARRDQLRTQLATIERRIDTRLENQYRRFARTPRRGLLTATRLALLHWSVLFRRRAPGSLQTRVARAPASCRGDLVADQALWRYLDAVTRAQPGRNDMRVDAVRALAAVQQQLSCLGERQLLLTDAYLVESHRSLVTALRAQRLDHLLPEVVDVAAPLMLLSFDAAKAHGARAFTYGWWIQQAGLVRLGLRARSSALSWLGIWLYDRRSGRMVGLDAQCKDLGRPCVNAGILVESLTRPGNLGNGDCSLFEMVSRGDGPSGYLCLGSVCAPPASGGKSPNTAKGCPDAARTPFGLACVEARAACNSPNRGGGAADRSRLCANTQPDLRNAPFQCVTSVVRNDPLRQHLRCVAEATGACAAPLDRLVKGLQEAAFRTAGCARGSIRADGGEVPQPTRERADQEFTNLKDDLRNEFQESLGRSIPTEDFDRAFATALAELEAAVFSEALVLGNLAGSEGDGGIAINPRLHPEQQVEVLVGEAIHALGRALGSTNEQDHAIVERLGLPRHDCSPDNPACSDPCSYESAQLEAATRCVREATAPPPKEPGFVDPSPLDDPKAPAWARCFAGMNDQVASGQKRCLGVDCPEDTTCDASNGRCVRRGQVVVAGGPDRLCFVVDCAEGRPVFEDGRCRCGGRTQGVEPPPELPTRPGGPVPLPQ